MSHRASQPEPDVRAPAMPSDLDGRPPGPVRAAGRLQHRPGEGWWLTDGLGELALGSEPPPGGEDGDLVVLDGSLDGGLLQAPVMVARYRPVQPPRLGPDGLGSSETERLRKRARGRLLRQRAALLRTVREFFADRGFVEVDTPALVRSPGLDLHLEAFAVEDRVAGQPVFLSTSPEYHMKRLLCGGLPRIFQLAHCFRRDEAGPQHNPEFLMLEWYRAFAEVEHVMADTEQLVRQLAETHTGAPQLSRGNSTVDLAPPFLRMTVAEAFERFAPAEVADPTALAAADEERFFRLWVGRLEPGLAGLAQPVFLHDFPAALASLARRKPGAPHLCERFELYVAGVELCNGFGELTDPVEQRQRLERDQRARAERDQPSYPIDERFLAALAEGMPPSAGNALGLDRLVALVTGAPTVADVQSFPLEWL